MSNELKAVTAKEAIETNFLENVEKCVYRWVQEDYELSQTRSNFQIEKFITLNYPSIPHAFENTLRNRRVMAEGLMQKVIEAKEKQREFDLKWNNVPKDQPIQWDIGSQKKWCWYDLDLKAHELYLNTVENEIRDRVLQIEFFDEVLDALVKKNGGPITKKQFDEESPKYWQRRFAKQIFDEMISRNTGINPGNLESIRQAMYPTVVENGINRIDEFPNFDMLMSDPQKFLLALQEKMIEGVIEMNGDTPQQIRSTPKPQEIEDWFNPDAKQ